MRELHHCNTVCTYVVLRMWIVYVVLRIWIVYVVLRIYMGCVCGPMWIVNICDPTYVDCVYMYVRTYEHNIMQVVYVYYTYMCVRWGSVYVSTWMCVFFGNNISLLYQYLMHT